MVPNLPTEKEKVTFPEYVIEIPDVLAIEIMRAIPKGPHLVQPTDCLSVNCPQALREEPINGVYLVSANGRVNLGSHYGTVQVADLTQEQAQDAIRKHLATIVTNPTVTASLAIDGSLQQVCGRQAVASDGTIRLGVYGGVYVCGLTLDQARVAIENQLSNYLVRPEVSINVAASRSKFYYVIADTGCGEQIFRFMATGNETVLDALSMINGVTVPCPTRRVWVARPAPPTCGMPDQILPVDWLAITRAGNTRTNYQLLPGDRVYVLGLPNAPFVPPAGWMAGIPH
jgi:protein involved in polysaccharide export with SLBB domain